MRGFPAKSVAPFTSGVRSIPESTALAAGCRWKSKDGTLTNSGFRYCEWESFAVALWKAERPVRVVPLQTNLPDAAGEKYRL